MNKITCEEFLGYIEKFKDDDSNALILREEILKKQQYKDKKNTITYVIKITSFKDIPEFDLEKPLEFRS
jgi:hypothetical protein